MPRQIDLLNVRSKIESVFDYLKEHLHLVSSFPRSMMGYLVRYLRILLSYQIMALSGAFLNFRIHGLILSQESGGRAATGGLDGEPMMETAMLSPDRMPDLARPARDRRARTRSRAISTSIQAQQPRNVPAIAPASAAALKQLVLSSVERHRDNCRAGLGIGPRQLSRLFAEHLDASPLQVAQSLRIQCAKRLLDDTDLPIALIAERAVFSSPRRMSAAFTHLYGQPPSALRKQQTIRNSVQRTKRVLKLADATHL